MRGRPLAAGAARRGRGRVVQPLHQKLRVQLLLLLVLVLLLVVVAVTVPPRAAAAQNTTVASTTQQATTLSVTVFGTVPPPPPPASSPSASSSATGIVGIAVGLCVGCVCCIVFAVLSRKGGKKPKEDLSRYKLDKKKQGKKGGAAARPGNNGHADDDSDDSDQIGARPGTKISAVKPGQSPDDSWFEMVDREGRPYFWNSISGEARYA